MSDGAEASGSHDPRENCSRWDGRICWNPLEGSECQCVGGIRAVAEITQAAPPWLLREVLRQIEAAPSWAYRPEARNWLNALLASPPVAPAPEPTPQQAGWVHTNDDLPEYTQPDGSQLWKQQSEAAPTSFKE